MLRDALARLHGEDRAAALYASREVSLLHGPRGRLPSYLPHSVHDRAVRSIGGPAPGPAFGDLMDRVSGWYKRRVQWAVLAVALSSCVALNVDAFAIGDRFLKDEAIKQAVTGQAERSTGTLEDTARRVEGLDELSLPVGWGEGNRPHGLLGWLGKLGGWLALAISIPLGASFWFDLFSKLSRQRATGVRDGSDRDDDSGADDVPGPSA